MVKHVGILALQGNFAQHKAVLDKLRVSNSLVLYPEDLGNCDLLIIPGGESTAMSKQIDRKVFRSALLEFVKEKPVFGTCAGMILLSKTANSYNLECLNAMNVKIDRNAYGTQINSFKADIDLVFNKKKKFKGYFIRAPKIISLGSDVIPVAYHEDDPVMVTNGLHYATSFHPEIGNDYRVHEYIINNINEK